jgi:hypothetical protein
MVRNGGFGEAPEGLPSGGAGGADLDGPGGGSGLWARPCLPALRLRRAGGGLRTDSRAGGGRRGEQNGLWGQFVLNSFRTLVWVYASMKSVGCGALGGVLGEMFF